MGATGSNRQIAFPPTSMNQRLSSGPVTMALGENPEAPAGCGKVVTTPAGVMRAIDPLPLIVGRFGRAGLAVESPSEVNQRLPSGPGVMPASPGRLPVEYSCNRVPPGLMTSTVLGFGPHPLSPHWTVNQMLLSGPRLMSVSVLAGMLTPKGLDDPRGLPPWELMAPTSLAVTPKLENHMLLSPLLVIAVGTLPISPLGNQSLAGLNDNEPSARWNLPICHRG